MKLSALRPCDGCGGGLLAPAHVGTFYVIRVSQAMLNPRAANQTLGLAQFFQGSLKLAETMGPCPDDAVTVFGEKDPALSIDLLLCIDCYCTRPLVNLVEVRASRIEAALAQGDGAGA